MFKKSEESEWTRFSKALGGKDPPREREESPEPAPAEQDAAVLAATPAQPASAPPVADAPQVAEAPERPAATDRDEGSFAPPTPRPADPWAGPSSIQPTQTSGLGSSSGSLLEPDDAESIVGEGTTVDGTLRSDHSIRIRGTVQGEVESKRNVVVEDEARVNAKISAQHISIAGQVNGELTCPGKVEITPSGRVTGEINTGSLIMQEGAYFEGHLKMLNRGERRDGGEGQRVAYGGDS